jgi:hypothetical protein
MVDETLYRYWSRNYDQYCNITQVCTSYYRPCSNGQIERILTNLKSQLRQYCSIKPDRWPQLLPSFIITYTVSTVHPILLHLVRTTVLFRYTVHDADKDRHCLNILNKLSVTRKVAGNPYSMHNSVKNVLKIELMQPGIKRSRQCEANHTFDLPLLYHNISNI